jgi:hypothetical protein
MLALLNLLQFMKHRKLNIYLSVIIVRLGRWWGDKEADYLTFVYVAGFGMNIFCKLYFHELIISHIIICVIL